MAGTTLNITDAGRAALIAGDHTGTNARKVLQVGFANAPFEFNAGLKALPNELKRVSTIAGENIAADTIHVTIRDDGSDQFKLYGFGLYLDNGVLLGTYCQPTPIMEKSPVAILLLAVDVVFKSLDVTALTFGDANFTNPPATTQRQGVVELATDQETQDGTDNQRAVTPAGLSARTATEIRTGLVQLATDAELVAGKDDAKAVTSKKVAAQLAKKADLAGSNKQGFAVAQATAADQAVPLGQADERYAAPANVKKAQDTADEALKTAKAALPLSGGDVTGPINLKGSAVELQLTDTQQPITLGRFRMVSSGGAFIVDRNTAANGDFSSYLRLLQIDGKGNAVLPGTITGGMLKTQTGVNLPAYNNDGKGFLEFGGDTVIWRMFMVGPTGNLVLAGYNVDGTNRNQPLFVNYTTGQVAFSARPAFDGAMPYDTKNLVNPLTADGGQLAANKGLTFGVGYGRSALVVSSNGTDTIGGAFSDWNGNRTPALQVDAPSNIGAYMGIRWTQWGQRHLAAIDCYAGGSNATTPYISMHVGGKTNAFTFNGLGDIEAQGAIRAGNGGGILGTDGNLYMGWAGMWLAQYLTNLNNGKAANGAQCQWASGIAEFGSVPTGESGGSADLPAPWVLVGLRNTFYRLYLRAVWLRNQ
ncbi:hypothetical protein LMG19087_03670 [Ralstonia wenshanensis]|uniref:hypothetical protein n=1 Tax=Ralstonia wenshanensis TaxID=2842456 RepID=UPI0028F65F53|nr:hypothetical protein [Ralstonia wenshanensis]CAJ0819153.1 hypothetical protein LMG19087_03670 [Ralstonia wenshanensis]